MLSMLPEDAEGIVTRATWLAVLAWLRPAEAATRRLVAWIALRMQIVPAPPAERGASGGGRKGGARTRCATPSLPLSDPRTDPGPPKARRAGRKPRPWVRDPLLDGPTGEEPHRAPMPDDPVDPAALFRRIGAVRAALGDLTGLAEKLARRQAAGRMRWVHPIRVGRPPGYRRRGRLPVHETLEDCNGWYWLAVREMEKVPP